MAIQTPPNGTILQNASMDAAVLRQALAAIVGPGVIGDGMLSVSANGTANMSVNVAAGEAWVPGTNLPNVSGEPFNLQGNYWILNDATVNVTISAADPTNPRIDLIVVQVLDSQYAGTTDTAQLAVVTGTPAVSPTVPAAPNNTIILAQVAVAANATSITSGNITDKRVYANPFPQRDSGYISVTPASGYNLATPAAQVRQIGNVVYMHGTVAITTGTFSGTATVATIPTGANGVQLPIVSENFEWAANTGASSCRVSIDTSGNINVTAPITGTTNYVTFSGCYLCT